MTPFLLPATCQRCLLSTVERGKTPKTPSFMSQFGKVVELITIEVVQETIFMAVATRHVAVDYDLISARVET